MTIAPRFWIPLLSLVAGCARPFTVQTPNGFVEVEDKEQGKELFDYRAAHPDGIVTAVKVLRHDPRGDLAFWSRAIQNEMRNFRGYALLEKRPVRSADGVAGEQLRFGIDLGDRPHLYRVTVFLDEDDIFILEQGGRAELVKAHTKELDDAIVSFRIRTGLGRFFSYGGR